MVKRGMSIKLFVLFGIVAIFLLGLFIFQNQKITGNSLYPIITPTDCSQTSVQILWDSFFTQSSQNIQISTTNTSTECLSVRALKVIGTEVFLLKVNTTQGGDLTTIKTVLVFHGNLTSSYASSLASAIGDDNTFNTLANQIYNSEFVHSNFLNREITSSNQANQVWSSQFKKTISSLNLENLSGEDIYLLNVATSSGGNPENYSANVLAKYALENLNQITYISSASSCIPNWTKQETICYSNDSKTTFYNDSNNCGLSTGKPSSTSVLCDGDSNGIIGVAANITSAVPLEVYISGTLINYSKNYSNISTLQVVDIKKNGSIIVSFAHNFSEALDLSNIEIKIDSNSSSFGYIIVDGIEDSKSVQFNRKNSALNLVCIHDSSSVSLSSFSENCEDNNEYLITCPGNVTSKTYNYTCLITGNAITVLGLGHSGVKEFSTSNLSSCSSNWTCSSWSNCTNNTKNRTCSDNNNCSTTLGRPNLTEVCTIIPAACVSNWTCSDWNPINCSDKLNQTRICSDKNNCNSLTGKPSELNVCNYEDSSMKTYLWIIILIAGILLFALVVFLVVNFLSNKKTQDKNNAQNNTPIVPVSTPVTYMSPQIKTEPTNNQGNPGDIPKV